MMCSSLSSDNTACIDHDECAQTGMCANGRCTNTDGGFKCECLPGFALSQSGLSCADVDECAENARICLRGVCVNSPGSYSCQCQQGYTQSPDGGFCQDTNECARYQDIYTIYQTSLKSLKLRKLLD